MPSDVYPEKSLQPDDQVIGTGPYKLVKYQPGVQTVLERNPDYWGEPPKNARVLIQYYKDSPALKLAVQGGDVDIAFRNLTPTDIESLSGESGLSVVEGQGIEIRYLVFNTKLDPGKNTAVRRSIAYLIDRQSIVDNVYNGTVQPLYSMIPAGLLGHTDAYKTEYGATPNPDAAKKELSDAGITTPVPIEIWWTPSHYGDGSADEYTEIKRQLEESGLFKVTLKSEEWDQYTVDKAKDRVPGLPAGLVPGLSGRRRLLGLLLPRRRLLERPLRQQAIDSHRQGEGVDRRQTAHRRIRARSRRWPQRTRRPSRSGRASRSRSCGTG